MRSPSRAATVNGVIADTSLAHVVLNAIEVDAGLHLALHIDQSFAHLHEPPGIAPINALMDA